MAPPNSHREVSTKRAYMSDPLTVDPHRTGFGKNPITTRFQPPPPCPIRVDVLGVDPGGGTHDSIAEEVDKVGGGARIQPDVCLQNDIKKARNMKLLLYYYEKMSDLIINLSESEVILIHGDDQLGLQYADLFNCQIGSFPLKYLGVPISPVDCMLRIGFLWWKKMRKTTHLER